MGMNMNKYQHQRKFSKYRRTTQEDLELWKHHASFGGADKNRMVTISTWLLGGSAAILWNIWTEQIDWEKQIDFYKLEFENPVRALGVALLGIGVSFFAGYISLLYGGYSNRNWEKADEIARHRGWYDLRASNNKNVTRNGILNPIAAKLARPCDPKETLAPVFQQFFFASMLLFFVHFVFAFYSAATICPPLEVLVLVLLLSLVYLLWCICLVWCILDFSLVYRRLAWLLFLAGLFSLAFLLRSFSC